MFENMVAFNVYLVVCVHQNVTNLFENNSVNYIVWNK